MVRIGPLFLLIGTVPRDARAERVIGMRLRDQYVVLVLTPVGRYVDAVEIAVLQRCNTVTVMYQLHSEERLYEVM